MKIFIFLVSLIFFCPLVLEADTLYLKSGRELTVDECRVEGDTIWCTLYGAEIGYEKSTVLRIEKDNFKPVPLVPIDKNGNNATGSEKPSAGAVKLEVTNWKWGKKGSYVIVEGEVRNISDSTLMDIRVVVSWHDPDGKFITSDWSFIDHGILKPRQTSPFKVNKLFEANMKKARIKFLDQSGAQIKMTTNK